MTLKTPTIVAEKVPIEQVWVRISTSTHHLTELRGSRFGHRTFPKSTNPACPPWLLTGTVCPGFGSEKSQGSAQRILPWAAKLGAQTPGVPRGSQ